MQLLKEAKTAFWALLMTVIILYGIIGGFFTPTRASIVACLYALVVGMYVYKGLTWRKLSFDLSRHRFNLVGAAANGGVGKLVWLDTDQRANSSMIASLILSISDNPLIVF